MLTTALDRLNFLFHSRREQHIMRYLLMYGGAWTIGYFKNVVLFFLSRAGLRIRWILRTREDMDPDSWKDGSGSVEKLLRFHREFITDHWRDGSGFMERWIRIHVEIDPYL